MTIRHGLAQVEAWLGALALLACLTVVSVEIVLRGVFGGSLQWSEELARYLLIWTVYLGAAAVTADNGHIRVGLLIERVGGAARRLAEAAILVASAAATAVMAWHGLELVGETRMLDLMSGESTLPVPIWVFQAIIPLAFSLMTLRLVLNLAHLVRHGDLPRTDEELALEA